jgi:hypothetical protein
VCKTLRKDHLSKWRLIKGEILKRQGNLVGDEVVESNGGSNERRQIDNEHLIVGLGRDGTHKFLEVQVRQEIEDFLRAISNQKKMVNLSLLG